MVERRLGAKGDVSHTPAEAARILHVPLRRVLEWLASGEIKAEQDPISGRWSIPESSLEGSEPVKQTEEELAWVYEKERLLAELGGWRARAERARGLTKKLRVKVEGLRRALEVEKMKQNERGGTPEA